jgi:hypothetical protein
MILQNNSLQCRPELVIGLSELQAISPSRVPPLLLRSNGYFDPTNGFESIIAVGTSELAKRADTPRKRALAWRASPVSVPRSSV